METFKGQTFGTENMKYKNIVFYDLFYNSMYIRKIIQYAINIIILKKKF